MPTNELLKFLTGILKNKVFWIVLGLILVYFIVRRNWAELQKTFAKRVIEYQQDDSGNIINISDNREAELRNIAQEAYTQIYNWFNSNYEVYKKLKYLNDQELLYVSRYYKSTLTRGKSLKDDISGELLLGTDDGTILEARLSKIGEL